MTRIQRLLAATGLLLACFIVSFVTFSKWGPKSDLAAYAYGSIALVFSLGSVFFLYPERKRIGFRLYATLAGFVATFWALEVFGGLTWYLFDKALRAYNQHQ